MKKLISFIALVFLLSINIGLYSQNPPKAKVVIINMTDSAATHVYGDRFNAKIQTLDIFDYGKYSVDNLTAAFNKSNLEVIEVEAPLYFRTAALINFVGSPTQKTKMWLSDLQSKYDADYLILINRKFIPEENMSERFLEKQQYGVATYQYAPDVLSIFSFVGYSIFSVKDMKAIKMNINHEKYVLTDIPIDRSLDMDELRVVPEEYLKMATEQLKYIADTRNMEVERLVMEYLDNH